MEWNRFGSDQFGVWILGAVDWAETVIIFMSHTNSAVEVDMKYWQLLSLYLYKQSHTAQSIYFKYKTIIALFFYPPMGIYSWHHCFWNVCDNDLDFFYFQMVLNTLLVICITFSYNYISYSNILICIATLIQQYSHMLRATGLPQCVVGGYFVRTDDGMWPNVCAEE